MRNVTILVVIFGLSVPVLAQDPSRSSGWLASLSEPRDYVLKRVSSYDRTGANADFRSIAPGETLALLEEAGPGVITHVWITIATSEQYHLKKLVLRMSWDDEPTPSVETPIGDFFGLGLGEYFLYESAPLAVGSAKALNSFFPMPFQKKARITVTNEGEQQVNHFYFNIDYRAYPKPLPADTLYFHAQYRQAAPAKGWTNDWRSNADPLVDTKPNLTGEGNYVWMETSGRGHFVGVTMSVLENQDGWWGEGDDMFFIDGEKTPSINGTGSEDYFLGAWDFGDRAFSYRLFGAPVKAKSALEAGGRSTASTWIHRLPLRSRSGPPSSTATQTTAPIISSAWPIGTRPSHTRNFPPCLPSTSGCRESILPAGRATQEDSEEPSGCSFWMRSDR